MKEVRKGIKHQPLPLPWRTNLIALLDGISSRVQMVAELSCFAVAITPGQPPMVFPLGALRPSSIVGWKRHLQLTTFTRPAVSRSAFPYPQVGITGFGPRRWLPRRQA